MAIPKIYYDTVEKKWIVVDKNGNSGAICFGDCTGSSGNCTGSLPCGDTGIFGGGVLNSVSSILGSIDYIIISIPGNAQNFGNLTVARRELAATSNGMNDRGVFGGGSKNTSAWNGNDVNTIDYIIISVPSNAQDFGDLTIAREHLAATSNGMNDRGVFGGGWTGTTTFNSIDYITISTPGNAQNFGNLSEGKSAHAATSNETNDRGIFGGGWNGNNNIILSTIEYITISTPGNAQNFGNLTVARYSLAATSNGTNDRGVFGGGYDGNNSSIIDYITISTPGNAQNFGNLTVTRKGLAAISNGTNNRGVFGGGWNGSYFSTIDYIAISTPGNAQNFGNLNVTRSWLGATSNA